MKKIVVMYQKAALLAVLLAPVAAFAQEETGEEVKSVEIRVVEDYKAQVRSAHKISEQPSFADTTSEKLPVVVRIQPKAMILDFEPEAIPSIRLGRVKLPKLPTQKVSIGGGNYASSYASFVLSSPRSKKNVWGIRAYHNGALGGVSTTDYARQPLYENELLADYQRATKNWNFKSQILLKGDYISYYGANTPLTVVLDTVPGVWQQQYGVKQQWLRTSNPTSKVIGTYRSGGVAYAFTHGGFQSFEHLAKTAHQFEINADDSKVYLDLDYQFSQNTNWAQDSGAASYHHFNIAPVTRGKNGILSYEFGLQFSGTQSAGLDSNRFEWYVFPRINLQAEILRRTLAIYGGWDGEAQQNTLRSLIAEAPFISLAQEQRLSGSNRGYVGMQGALVGKVQYRLEGSMAFLNDAVVFERDSLNEFMSVANTQIAALQVGYAENVVRTSLRGELNLPLKYFTASTYAQLNAFSGDEFIGREGRVMGAMVSYSINELSLQTNLKYVGGRYAVNGYSLEDYLDWSASVNYEINDHLSVSLRGFNLLSRKYQLWEGYYVRGTRGLFTLNYQF